MELKPAEIKQKIISLKESMKLDDVIVKTNLSYLDVDQCNERIFEQQVILNHARSQIEKIRSQHDNAVLEIGKIERTQRYDKRQIVLLENYAKIQKIKDLVAKIREEKTDGSANTNHGE